MLNSNALGKNMESLRDDATKMIADLGRLQADLVKVSKVRTAKLADETGEVAVDLVDRLDDGLQAVTEGLADLSVQAKKQLKAIDKNLHKRPYSYYTLGGALAVGLTAGLLIPFAVGRRH